MLLVKVPGIHGAQDLHVDFWEVQRGALLAKKKIDGVLKE